MLCTKSSGLDGDSSGDCLSPFHLGLCYVVLSSLVPEALCNLNLNYGIIILFYLRRRSERTALSSLVGPDKNRQMSIKVAKNEFTRKWMILTPLQKSPKNVRDLGELIVAKGF